MTGGLQYKWTTGFSCEYSLLISSYSWALKYYKITREYSPLPSNYSRALLDMYCCTVLYMYVRSDQYLCVSRTLENITRVICEMGRGMQKSTSVSVNLDVTCTVRVCIDAHDLNKAICQSRYEMQIFNEILPALTNAYLFSVLDTKEGFHLVKLDNKCFYLTTFWSPYGIYRYLHIPFGISSLLRNFKYKCMWYAKICLVLCWIFFVNFDTRWYSEISLQ